MRIKITVKGGYRDTTYRAPDITRISRVFFSNGAWSLHRWDGDAVKQSRHDSRAYAITKARAWVRNGS